MINSLLTLSALIERKVEVSPDADSTGDIILSWEILEAEAKCFIWQYSEISGNLEFLNSGYEFKNKFIGIFKNTCLIQIGDRVTCTGFPILYVDSYSSEVNASTGKIHHIICQLKISAG